MNICDSCAKEPDLSDIINSPLLNDRTCLLEKLFKSKKFKEEFAELFCKDCEPSYVLQFKVVENLKDSRGVVVQGLTTLNFSQDTITVSLNPLTRMGNQLIPLYLVQAFVHELYHAKIYGDLICNGINFYDLDLDKLSELDNAEYFYTITDPKKRDDWQHHYIAANYMQSMSEILAEVDDGSVTNKDVFEAMPWSGLVHLLLVLDENGQFVFNENNGYYNEAQFEKIADELDDYFKENMNKKCK